MARANNGGWDFVKQSRVYQYKEDWCVAVVRVVEDKSDAETYRFKLKVLASTHEMGPEFECSHAKDVPGYWSGMIQFYQDAEYIAHYKFIYDKADFENTKFFLPLKGVPQDGSKS